VLTLLYLKVATSATALNSEDSFVLVTPSTVYVWQGLGANADELTVATSVASTLAGCYLDTAGREVIQCKEGSEDPEFWNAIGGKQEYVLLKPVCMSTCSFSPCFCPILMFFCLFVSLSQVPEYVSRRTRTSRRAPVLCLHRHGLLQS
jgi:hypothetical protein